MALPNTVKPLFQFVLTTRICSSLIALTGKKNIGRIPFAVHLRISGFPLFR
jgi:hypothetical protein